MIKAYTDGSGSNPQGYGAASFIIVKDKSIIHQDTKVLRNVTNNVAEYTAVEMAIQWAVANGYDYLDLRSDSQLVVNQINGSYQTKNGTLGVIRSRVLNYIQEHNLGVHVAHLPRTNIYIATADNLNRLAIAEVM